MIISPITSFYMSLEKTITNEINKNGILSDVETILTDSYHDEYIELPLLWIEKQPITPGKVGHFTDTDMYLQIPVHIICCSDENSEYSTSEKQSLSIASRVITTILKHVGEYVNTEENFSITDITINSIDPTGTFEIPSKRIIIPGTRLDLTFEVSIDWNTYQVIKDNKITDTLRYNTSMPEVMQIDIEEDDIKLL